MLLSTRNRAKKTTVKELQLNEIIARTEDFVAQMKLLRTHLAKINGWSSTDHVRWKHELDHYNRIKQDIDYGVQSYSSVHELEKALKDLPPIRRHWFDEQASSTRSPQTSRSPL